MLKMFQLYDFRFGEALIFQKPQIRSHYCIVDYVLIFYITLELLKENQWAVPIKLDYRHS